LLGVPYARAGVHTWKDGKRQSLEEQIPAILKGLFDQAQREKEAEIERARVRALEQERARQEGLRSERRAIEQELICDLESQAGAWMRANMLRRYVRAARRAMRNHPEMIAGQHDTGFLDWAEQYINQLDPLHFAPRNSDLRDPASHWDIKERLESQFARLSGHEGQRSRKLFASPRMKNSEAITAQASDSD
jgi:hypothetical protein